MEQPPATDLLHDPEKYSSRVCNKCARKIRNLSHLYLEIKSSLESSSHASQPRAKISTPAKENIHRKRLLNTPQGSSPRRKAARVSCSPMSEKKSSRKSLTFEGRIQYEDQLDASLNIDGLQNTGLHVKVAMVSKCTVITRIPHEEQIKRLVRQLCNKNWKAASNTVLQHQELFDEVKGKIAKLTSKELADYLKKESILLLRNPDELIGFSSVIFLQELRVFCPTFHAILIASAGLQEDDVKKPGLSANSVALAAATICRDVNPQASALHYRISAVLFHSGVKHEDLKRLNRLGVCMSPDSILRAQRKMAFDVGSKVQVWKREIEENKAALLLGKEIQKTQLPDEKGEDNMQIDLDFAIEDNLECYDNFTNHGYSLLMNEVTLTEISHNISYMKISYMK